MTRHSNPSRPGDPLRRAIAIVVLAAVPATLAACGDDDDQPAETTETMSTEVMSPEVMSTDMAAGTMSSDSMSPLDTEMMSEATSG